MEKTKKLKPLTKDDWDELLYALVYNHDTRTFPPNPTMLVLEIKKWKEDAEKLEDACNDAAMQLMRAQKAEMIVERLKKRIEEFEEKIKENPTAREFYFELQKILGEK